MDTVMGTVAFPKACSPKILIVAAEVSIFLAPNPCFAPYTSSLWLCQWAALTLTFTKHNQCVENSLKQHQDSNKADVF